MSAIPDAAKKVPMLFRAQIGGRCQLQRLIKDEKPDALQWADEWVDKVYPELPELGEEVQSRIYPFTWRFITNSGQDDGVIRPVIGARGYPFYPGSSMKGIFRRACTPEQADRYCGKPLPGRDWQPGILRFHGGYPIDASWTDRLVDIVHPQQNWQVKDQQNKSSAFVQISLYKPTLRFGISSTIAIDESEWTTIWDIWERAIATGIGSRVCAGYGQIETQKSAPRKSNPELILFQTRLKGQGQAAKLIDDNNQGEFRSNIFRAALRGHALRWFGGLTDERAAERLVEQLFGGVQGQGTVGLLGMRFQADSLNMGTFGKGSYVQPTYEIEGELTWFLTRQLEQPDQREALQKLVAHLIQFSMVLGGFGKSWRRADHRLFFEEYYEDSYKALIGCHWQWVGDRALRRDVQVRKLDKVSEFLAKVQQVVQQWMQLQGETPNPTRAADWREAWHPQRVQVWGREAENNEESEAIRWFHGPYQERIARVQAEGSIYRTSIAGQIGQIGRIWHRMYPVVRLVKNPQDPNGAPIPKPTTRHLELLTLFPNDSPESDQFLAFLAAQQPRSTGFQKLWGE
jgi:CRISPR-associated protein Cmr6